MLRNKGVLGVATTPGPGRRKGHNNGAMKQGRSGEARTPHHVT